MKARIVVGAHYGLKDWLAQRITAVIMALYTLVLGAAILFCGAAESQENWRALFTNPLMGMVTSLFVVALCYHAWVGVRDIWMDYVKPASVRLTLHVLTLVALVGYAAWAVRILWRL
ncbi:MAG: succinate dehydrogenase, hydrophobic membrane anchor protein [Proteobacteria bacterium]|nr:succinate dehydrogenase, hydrophobic membrane anchor protein [Pseudomonadota bacterium]HQR02710.1 succinate dehydrogenase, hydrophobic membrane anchor protein [Rhodocyclaceae bacterium]